MAAFNASVVAGVAVELNIPVAPQYLAESRNGNVDVIVNGLPEERSAHLFHANDRDGHVADFQGLSDGIDTFEEFGSDVAADNGDRSGVFNFMGGDKTSNDDGLILDLAHVGGDSGDLGAKQFFVAVLHVDVVTGLRSDFLALAAIRREPLVVRNPEFLVALYRSIPVLIGPFSLMGESVHHEVIDAQDPGNRGHDVRVKAADRRPDDHDRRHADNDPDQGKESPHLLGKNRPQSDQGRVGEKVVDLSHESTTKYNGRRGRKVS